MKKSSCVHGFLPHAIPVFDGVVEHRLKCPRCERELPDSQFTPIYTTGRGVAEIGLHSKPRVPYVYLHPLCRRCLKQRRSALCGHVLYSPALHREAEKQLTSIRSRTRASSGRVCGIDEDDVIGLYLVQEGKCALSGERLSYGRGAPLETKMSVDRIDSGGNYTADNVQLVTARVNLMKSDLTQRHFIKICLQIAAHVLKVVDREKAA